MTRLSVRLLGVGVLAGALLVAPATFAASRGGHAGGSAGAHMSDQGRADTNGPNAADRDFGRDRAEDRAQLKDTDDIKVKRAMRDDAHKPSR
jgi:hypothetical protein